MCNPFTTTPQAEVARWRDEAGRRHDLVALLGSRADAAEAEAAEARAAAKAAAARAEALAGRAPWEGEQV